MSWNPMINLIGKVYERWFVLYIDLGRSGYWICKCSCPLGTIRSVSGKNLKSGLTKSCGCFKKQRLIDLDIIDLKNKKIYRWFVIKKDKERSGYWICKCSCPLGTIKSVAGNSLRNNTSKSCGCLLIEKNKERTEDLTNNIYKKIKAINYIENGKWLCLCDCGNITIVDSSCLKSGNTTSCGNCNLNGTRVSYDDWKDKLLLTDKIRNCHSNPWQLEVRCKKCDKWFGPTCQQVYLRVRSINALNKGENHFYCCQKCKDNCPVFWKKLWAEGDNPKDKYNRPGHNQWAIKVKERANYKCELCGSKNSLEAHHEISWHTNKSKRLDLENGWCFCIDCHKMIHSRKGCRYHELTKEYIEKFKN